jgi:hypothetical protein
MENRHAQGREKIRVTVVILGCNVSKSTGVAGGKGNAYGHLEHRLHNMMVTQNSLDT